MDINDIQFNRPDLGKTKIETNLGVLTLNNPCAFDFYKLQAISKDHEGIDKFFFMAEYLGDSIATEPVTVPTLMSLDGKSFQKLITHFTELMLALVPDLSEDAKKLIDMM